MGYNTWNAFHCEINETVVAAAAVRMKTLGLTDFGYEFVNIDDCYSEKQRNKDGDIVADPVRFPSGMRNLTDFIRTLGLKSGIYSDAGWYTCAGYPGSFQNERRYVAYQLCVGRVGISTQGYQTLSRLGLRVSQGEHSGDAAEASMFYPVPFDEIVREGIVGKYGRMAQAIKDLAQETGKAPVIFSLCEWGKAQPWLWARDMGQSWRTTGDIEPRWDSIASIINRNSFISWASDFYGHNDMDMLEVGNGNLTYEESKSHFTAWALMKSPLLIGTDLNAVTKKSVEILTNKEIIAINQDKVVGTAITPFRWGVNPDWTFNDRYPAQYWSGTTENGTVFMLLNVLDEPADMFFTLTESPWIRAGRQYAMRDLWTHTDNGTAVRNVTIHGVPAHGVVALLLRDAGDEPEGTQPPCAQPDWCMDKNGTLIEREL
ncbi:glycoside hydrolase family 27 protein [Pleurotus ostreatus PC15]|uniref:Alpha-galactosidase n=1 Tax=Pleurotus ostreatus (strain PC15) TaxID=1137138 RepID=A0A067NVN8_PLEO1|nr:glycoside hydrolase family 27 protein [Pleurotus ostreatus PC15]